MEEEKKSPSSNLSQYVKSYPPRSEIIKEGESDKDFFCLLEGKVEIWKASEDGKKIKVGEIDKKGSYFGEISYLLNESRTASIIADKEVKVLKFSGNMLPELILKQPNLGLKLCMTLAERLKGTTSSQKETAMQRDELRSDITSQHLELALLFQKVFIMLSSLQTRLNNEHIKAILSYMSSQKILRAGKQPQINEKFLNSLPEALVDYVKQAYEEGLVNRQEESHKEETEENT